MTSPEDLEPPEGLPLPLDGATRVYAIIGDPIEQVGSPRVFNTLFRAGGIRAVLLPFHVAVADLARAIEGFRGIANLDGIVVTVPHKAAAVAHVDALGANAARIGALNAIRREADGRLVGENFDGEGCVRGLTGRGHDVAGRRALLVGAGGAGAAVGHALADAGVAAIRVAEVDMARAEALATAITAARPAVRTEVGAADPTGFDLVVNCTPLGMKADDPYPVDPERLSPDTLVVDVVLKPRISPLLVAAEARGCATQPGHLMLEGQAEAVARYFGVAS